MDLLLFSENGRMKATEDVTGGQGVCAGEPGAWLRGGGVGEGGDEAGLHEPGESEGVHCSQRFCFFTGKAWGAWEAL